MKKLDFSQIKRHVDSRIEAGILPGADLAAAVGEERVYELTAGFRDFGAKIPLERNDFFRIASMTKPICAAAVLIAQDRGLLSVSDPVSKYIPGFRNLHVGKAADGKVTDSGAAAREMTVFHVLTHSSGLCSGAAGDLQYPLYGQKEGMSLAEAVEGYPRFLLDFSPGETELYSGTVAMDVAARIVEIVSGTDYGSFLSENIFRPLGMEETGYSLTEKQSERLVSMYRLRDDKSGMEPENFGKTGFPGFPAGYPSGAAGLFSTLDDYMKFAQMLAGSGQYKGKRILSAEAVREMSVPRHPIGFSAAISPYFNWGYGVRVLRERHSEIQPLPAGSFGWSGAFSTHFFVNPETKLAAVFMANLDNAGGAGAVTGVEFERGVTSALGEK